MGRDVVGSSIMRCFASLACACLAMACLVFTSAAWAGATVETITGDTYYGDVTALGPVLTMVIESEKQSFAWTDVRRLAFTPPAESLADDKRGPFTIRLRDGCELIGEYDRAVGVGPRITTTDATYLVLPRELWQFQRRELPPPVAERVQSALGETAEEDRIIVRKGLDVLVLRGEIVDVATEQIRFEWNRRTINVPWTRVAGIAWAGEQAPRADVHLEGPGPVRFVGRLVGGESDHLKLRTRALGEVNVPRQQITKVTAGLGRMVYLSDMQPLRIETHSQIMTPRDMTTNTTLFNHPITLDSEPFHHGICMHSRTLAIYRLDGRFDQFVSSVGISDDVRPQGNATVRIYGDGELIWQNDVVRGDQSPLRVGISVAGVRVLTLEVDYGGDLDLSDHVCWGAARLIRP